MNLPQGLRELTPDWLTGVLRESGAVRLACVRSVEPELIGNFSNQLWRLRLGYDREEAEAPASLVLKRPRPGGSADIGQGLADEIRFYNELGARLPVRTPRFHFGATDEFSDQALLLMEDVTGFAPIEWLSGATDGHARLAIEELARLHAHCWGQVPDLEWIPSYADADHLRSLEKSYERCWTEKRAVFLRGAPSFVEIGDGLCGRVAASLRPLGEPETLLHGDAHFENLALIRAEDGRPSVLFHDWAGVRRGLASLDVAVFMTMSYPAEARRRVEEALVRLHAETLQSAGVRDQGEPWERYRMGVLAWAVRLVHFTRGAPRKDPLMEASRRMVLDRCTRAAVDLGVGELIS